MAKGYAYLDKYEILHVVDEKAVAEKYTGNGKIEPIDFPNDYGYPTVEVHGRPEQIVVYTADGIREKDGLPIPSYITELIGKLK
ncbi:hypothetical protein D3C74_49140 [compost metagenome]